MEAVARVPVDMEPRFDMKMFDAQIAALQKRIRTAKSGSYSRESNLVADMIQSLVSQGRVSSAIQGRRLIEKRMGGRLSSFSSGILLEGQEKARTGYRDFTGSFSQRQIARMRPELGALASSYNNLLQNYATFKVKPTEEAKSALLEQLTKIGAAVEAIKQTRKDLPKSVKRIEKDAGTLQKELSGLKPLDTTHTGTGVRAVGAAAFLRHSGNAFARLLGSVFGITSVMGGIKQFLGLGVQAMKEGSDDLAEQAMYGATRNIAIGRSRAKMYGLDESITAAPERYALDFRQRMMWGEVSDKEWIALSRMGALGQKIVSGEAARDPKAFQREIENYIAANRGNEAEVRQMLGWLGWSPQLMKYGAVQYSAEETDKYQATMAELIKYNKDNAVAALDLANAFKLLKEEIKAASAGGLADFAKRPESARRLGTAWRLAGYSAEELGAVNEMARRIGSTRSAFIEEDVKHGGQKNALRNLSQTFPYDYYAPSVTNYNEINVYTTDPKTAGQSVVDALPGKSIMSKISSWFNSNSGGGE